MTVPVARGVRDDMCKFGLILTLYVEATFLRNCYIHGIVTSDEMVRRREASC
jgi:hypothetical protein